MLEKLENEARVAKKGLWADPQPLLPWEKQEGKSQILLSSAGYGLITLENVGTLSPQPTFSLFSSTIFSQLPHNL